LTRTADFEAVRLTGKRIRTATLELRTLASLRRLPRVGVIVPRHKHSAVARNLVKRRLRELIRQLLWPMLVTHPPCDVVVRANPSAYGVPITTLAADLAKAMRRLGTTPPAT